MNNQHPKVSTQSLSADAIHDLQARFAGKLLHPSDEGYDSARTLWNAAFDKRPALIAQCASNDDVAAAVTFARAHRLPLAVRGGGHSAPGHGLIDDGLVIDLSQMHDVRVDPERRIAYTQGGATWKDFDAATHRHGLATTGGVVSTVGVGGLTLGGGLGWLMRSHGLACDNLLGAEIVTAEGDVIRADESAHPDLFWGIRGGGGNFGVVTTLELRLHPLHTVLGGIIAHPLDRATDALRFYRDFMRSAPDELTVYAGLFPTPEGIKSIALILCYAGDPEEGEQAIKPLLDWGPPIMSNVGPMPYPQVQQLLDESNAPGFSRYFRGELVEDLEDEIIERIVNAFNEAPLPFSGLLVESYGGEMGRVPVDATAFSHRSVGYGIVILAQWIEPSEEEKNMSWARHTQESLRRYASGAYVNYLGEESEGRVREAYVPATYARLAGLKATYDPDNLFRVNQNIPPNAAAER